MRDNSPRNAISADPSFPVAHTPSRQNPRWHLLVEHTLEVAKRAKTFATSLGLGADGIVYFLGLLHDLGKWTPEFQRYLRDCNNGVHRVKGSAPHKQYGAFAATLLDESFGGLWKLPLHGHHGGLKSPTVTEGDVDGTFAGAGVTDPEAFIRALLQLSHQTNSRLAVAVPDTTAFSASLLLRDGHSLELFLRLLFSCLVDADALDTEAHNEPAKATKRDTEPSSLKSLRDTLVARQEGDFAGKSGTVNDIRRDVYDACCTVGRQSPPGFFTLTVPTGGGKTRSSLAFALEHALAHPAKRGKRHIIYAIPYTSIIDQTADVFRKIFEGEEGVILEHHSAVEARTAKSDDAEDRPGEMEAWRLLAAENWDAPIVVTTTVQLFESLFARKPGACRKLHRLANSVIVLDEVQCLPVNLLAPIRSALQTLVTYFGATVVFCTATQPAHAVGAGAITATPILPDETVNRHFRDLKRVNWTVHREPWGWERVAEEMQSVPNTSVLCVLNTRREAQDLMAALDAQGVPEESVLHLSTLLCPAHRRAVIRSVKERLTAKEALYLVSTQVIEAGVDLSFPRLFRALGPLERMIQAAGRCNRENELAPGRGDVVVFMPEKPAVPAGWYERCYLKTRTMIEAGQSDFDDPRFVTEYFADLFAVIETFADNEKVMPERLRLDYEEVAARFRMIKQDTVDVFVTEYEPAEANAVLDEIKRRGMMTRALWRKAAPYTVSLYRHLIGGNAPELPGVPGFRVWTGNYDPRTGIPLNAGVADTAIPADLFSQMG